MKMNLESQENREAQMENRKKYQELYFRTIVESKLLESFIRKFEELNFSQEKIKEFRDYASKLSGSDLDSLVATPWKMKQIFLDKQKKAIESGEMSMKSLIDFIISKNKEFGRALAYHTSNADIKPKPIRDGLGHMTTEWIVNATEEDHRDNDLPRAYISFDYMHLYRTKDPKYLYIVGYRKGEGTGAVADKRENWGRGYSFDVIDQIKLIEVDKEVSKLVSEQENRETKKAKAA